VSYVKRYLTAFFLSMSAIVLIVGLRLDFQWNGIISWGLSFIFLLFAAYYTKYIPNDKKRDDTK
jgi:membrane protein implicated in regulation of membrane protease activity